MMRAILNKVIELLLNSRELRTGPHYMADENRGALTLINSTLCEKSWLHLDMELSIGLQSVRFVAWPAAA